MLPLYKPINPLQESWYKIRLVFLGLWNSDKNQAILGLSTSYQKDDPIALYYLHLLMCFAMYSMTLYEKCTVKTSIFIYLFIY